MRLIDKIIKLIMELPYDTDQPMEGSFYDKLNVRKNNMEKDKKYDDNYIKYLGQLSLLNITKNNNLITDKEYIEMKKFLIGKYKVQDSI